MWPLWRGHFWPQGHTLNKLGKGLLCDATYQISKLYAPWLQRRRFLKFSSWKSIFSLCDLVMLWTRTIWTIFKEGHIRIIPTKFGQNPASSLGGDILWSNCWRRTTHDGRRTSNDHNDVAHGVATRKRNVILCITSIITELYIELWRVLYMSLFLAYNYIKQVMNKNYIIKGRISNPEGHFCNCLIVHV